MFPFEILQNCGNIINLTIRLLLCSKVLNVIELFLVFSIWPLLEAPEHDLLSASH